MKDGERKRLPLEGGQSQILSSAVLPSVLEVVLDLNPGTRGAGSALVLHPLR
jgi:hypothetical protein